MNEDSLEVKEFNELVQFCIFASIKLCNKDFPEIPSLLPSSCMLICNQCAFYGFSEHRKLYIENPNGSEEMERNVMMMMSELVKGIFLKRFAICEDVETTSIRDFLAGSEFEFLVILAFCDRRWFIFTTALKCLT